MKTLFRLTLLIGCLVMLLPARPVSAQSEDPATYCLVLNPDSNAWLVIAITNTKDDCGAIVKAINANSIENVDWDWGTLPDSYWADGDGVSTGAFTYKASAAALQLSSKQKDPRYCWLYNSQMTITDDDGNLYQDDHGYDVHGAWLPVAFSLLNEEPDYSGISSCQNIAGAFASFGTNGALPNGATKYGWNGTHKCLLQDGRGTKCLADRPNDKSDYLAMPKK